MKGYTLLLDSLLVALKSRYDIRPKVPNIDTFVEFIQGKSADAESNCYACQVFRIPKLLSDRIKQYDG